MKWARLKGNWDSTVATNKMLIGVNFILAIAVAGLVVKVVDTRERLVLIPPHLDRQVELSWSSANADYYKGFGLYIATLMANVTPKTVEFTKSMLGTLMNKEVYAPVRLQLTAMAEDPIFQRGTNMSYFTPSQVIYEVETRKVFVVGSLITSALSNVDFGKSMSSTDVQNVVYEFRFEMANGRPLVTEFTSYMGTQARTMKWYRQNQINPREPIPEHLANPKEFNKKQQKSVTADVPVVTKE